MPTTNGRLTNVDNLSAELLKIKADLEYALEINLNKIEDNNKFWDWALKRQAAEFLKRAYEDTWLEILDKEGIVVAPAFESVEETTSENTLHEEFNVYENLWN